MVREYQEQTVYEALMDRFKLLFEEFENIYISFSGGKDSGLPKIGRQSPGSQLCLYLRPDKSYGLPERHPAGRTYLEVLHHVFIGHPSCPSAE